MNCKGPLPLILIISRQLAMNSDTRVDLCTSRCCILTRQKLISHKIYVQKSPEARVVRHSLYSDAPHTLLSLSQTQLRG